MRKKALALLLALTLVMSAFTENVLAATTGTGSDDGTVALSALDYTGSDPSSASGTDVTFSVPSDTLYDITGGFTSFTASVATVSGGGGPGGPGGGSSSTVTLTANVKDSGGGTVASKTATLSSTAQDFSIDSFPAGAATLELKLTSSSTSSYGPSASAVFSDATLSIDPGNAVKLKKITLSADRQFLDSGNTALAAVTGKRVNGTEIDSSELTVTYTSDNTAVATVDNSGTITAIGDGVATITASAYLAGSGSDSQDSGAQAKTASTNVVVGSGLGNNSNSWAVNSPTSGKVKLLFFLDAAGSLHFAVFSSGKPVVGVSPAGIVTSAGSYTSGLSYSSQSATSIHETYSMISGKKSQYNNNANQTTLVFSKSGDPDLSVIARAYDDGFAFRYSIDSADLSVSAESTGYQVPADSQCVHMSYTNTFEGKFYTDDIADVTGSQAVPFLYSTTDGTNVLLMEAALSGDNDSYAGTMLKPSSDGSGMMNVSFTSDQSGSVTSDTSTFTSPWRCAVVGSYSDIIETQLFENLNDASTISDTSWITPGATTWTWLNGSGCSDGDVYMKYIDLAAEMGWKYVLLDEGWQPKVNGSYSGYYSWFKTVCKHAADKGIGLLVWTNYDLVNSDDPAASNYVGKIANWVAASTVTDSSGNTVQAIKGIKADFFNSESQDIMKAYKLISEECATLHLVVNYHGANKPTGERRTLPNVIAREGVYGNEHSDVSAAQNCLLPFTRAATGPTDYTPLLYDDGSDLVSTNQLSALAVLLECGIPCFADAAENYRASNLYSWFKDMPAAWADTKLLGVDLGSYVAEARKSREQDISKGAAEWYASAICTDARDATFDLSFLDSGKTYYAWIYQDGETNDDCNVSFKQVSSTDTLTVPMRKNGGCNVKFTTAKPSSSSTITLSDSSKSLKLGKQFKLTTALDGAKSGIGFNSVNWASSNDGVAAVVNGKVTATGVGTATITASTGLDDSVKATCTVTVAASDYQLTNDWTIHNENATNFLVNSENSVSLITEDGNWKPMGGDSTDKNVTTTGVSGDFTATVRLTYTPSTAALPAGMAVCNDGDTISSNSSGGGFGGGSSTPYVVLLRGTTTTSASSNANDENGVNVTTVTKSTSNTITLKTGSTSIVVTDQFANTPTVYLRLVRSGDVFTGYYSKDNINWIQVADGSSTSVTNADIDSSTGVGVATVNGSGRYDNVAAVFSGFTLNGTAVAFAKSLSGGNSGGSTGGNSGSSGGSSSSGSGSSSTSSGTAGTGTQGTVNVSRDPSGKTTVAVTIIPGSSPSVANGTASFGVTVPSDALASAATAATAQNHARIQISVPEQTIIGQLNFSGVQAVSMTMTAPSDIAYGTGTNIDVTIGMSAAVLSAAAQAKKDVTVSVVDSASGKVAYAWTFSGAGLAASGMSFSDINLALNTMTTTLSPAVSSAVPSANKGLLLTFAGTGSLPASSSVRVSVADYGFKPGQTLYLYYYDPSARQLETVRDSVYQVDADGYATIVINHESQYVLLPQAVAAASPVSLDTGSRLSVKSGKTYQFRITSSKKPTFISGNSSVFKVEASGQKGSEYFFKATAVGKPGQSAGFYLNGEKSARTVATIQ